MKRKEIIQYLVIVHKNIAVFLSLILSPKNLQLSSDKKKSRHFCRLFWGLDQMISDIPDADLFTGKADILSKIGNVSLNTGCVDDIDFPVAVHVAAIKIDGSADFR